MKNFLQKFKWFIAGGVTVILLSTGIAYAAVSVPNATQKGDLPTGKTTGNYQLLHPGSDGLFLQSSSTATNGLTWATASTSGGTGLSSLNGLVGSTQTFATSSTNAIWSITSSGSTHTFNLPNNFLTTTTAASTYYLQTNPSSYISLGSLSGTSPITYNNGTGAIGLQSNLGSNNYWTSGFLNASTSQNTTLTVVTSASIPRLSNLTSDGFVKTGSANGTLTVDTNTYLTGNQTVTLSGDVSGSGATAITTAIGNGKVTNAMLQNAYTGITAGAGLTGGGNTALGATSTLSIGTKVWTTTLEATTSNFTNLNASSSIFTNATTTGQSYHAGSIYFTGLTGQSCLGTTAAGLLQAGTCGAGSSQSTSTIQSMFQGGSWNMWTSGFINASTSILTSATTTNLGILGITGKLLATDPNGVVIATSSPIFTLASGTNTTASGNAINLNATILGVTLFSGTTVNATSGNFTNLGVGTTTPSVRLVLQNAAGTNDAIRISSSTGATLSIFDYQGHLQIATTTDTSQLSIMGTAGQTIKYLNISSSTGASVFSISDNPYPNLQIGTTTMNTVNFVAIDSVASATSTMQLGDPTHPACTKIYSPNGTAYYITVTNAGVLTTSATVCKTGF